MPDESPVAPDLASFRAEIDAIDQALLDLLARRRGVVESLFDWKRAHGVPLIDPAREAALLDDRRARAAALGLSPEIAGRIFRAVLDGSRDQR